MSEGAPSTGRHDEPLAWAVLWPLSSLSVQMGFREDGLCVSGTVLSPPICFGKASCAGSWEV